MPDSVPGGPEDEAPPPLDKVRPRKSPNRNDTLLGMRAAATYREIQKWVQQEFGFVPETCWIAHCKELYGLPVGEAPNRLGDDREKPCPPEKRTPIKKAFEHFGMMEGL